MDRYEMRLASSLYGNWWPPATPFVATFSGHPARMNVGAVDAWRNAQVKRYNDW